jgi:hypothetical protein
MITMGKITKTIRVEVPAPVLYNAIKNVDRQVTAILQDFFGIIIKQSKDKEDIRNRRIVVKGPGVEMSINFAPSGKATDTTVHAKYRFGGGTSAKIGVAQVMYAIKGIEAGYLAASKTV